MLNHRLQVLVSKEQRNRLDAEARARGGSIGALVREAIDARYGATPVSKRIKAVEEIAAMRVDALPSPAEINSIIDAEHEATAAALERQPD